MLYNVSIMVNLWGALTSRDVRLLKNQIDKLDSLPENCWFVILNAMGADLQPYESSSSICDFDGFQLPSLRGAVAVGD